MRVTVSKGCPKVVKIVPSGRQAHLKKVSLSRVKMVSRECQGHAKRVSRRSQEGAKTVSRMSTA